MRILAFTACSLALLAACGSDPPPPAQQPTATPTQPPPPPAPLDKQQSDVPTRSNISIAEDIKKACGITDSEAFFAYDSANVRPQDKAVLTKLATCFMTGPLKGRSMRLVGHADPRGNEEYNMALGGRRADNVASAIGSAGMDSTRMSTSSRGKMDATGTDESGWEKDRRVDIMLAN
ncbi:MAG TPA: OmpA family protein [Polyangiaceae bacterium]